MNGRQITGTLLNILAIALPTSYAITNYRGVAPEEAAGGFWLAGAFLFAFALSMIGNRLAMKGQGTEGAVSAFKTFAEALTPPPESRRRARRRTA